MSLNPQNLLNGNEQYENFNIRLAPDGDIVIAVLQRGHVAVGRYSQKGMICRLKNAAIIRRWGTSKGLGELAQKGCLDESAPNGPTVLDLCPDISFHARECIFLMDVNQNAWRNCDF